MAARRQTTLTTFTQDDAARLAEALAGRLDYRFEDPGRVAQALVHPSAARSATASNQRLEFLGDRVLGLVVADMLVAAFPEEEEGALARRFAALVRRETLVRVARDLDLGAYLMLGKSEQESGGRETPANLADACEALLGALFLDGGYEVARRFVWRIWRPLMAEAAEPPQDAKTKLQEWAQAQRAVLPQYRLVGEEGPAHAPTFEIEVEVAGLPTARGRGRSKQAAEQAAAESLLEVVTRGHG